ncbi:thiamine pyrophosphate-dependent enzyme [Chloroflexota bacterium]
MMESLEALKVISQHRGNAIVIAAESASFEWPKVSTNPELDLIYRGAMGKPSSVGLGLALARPDRKVIVLDGDGSLLMNLGSLITIVNMAPPNLIFFVLDNGVYRTTGCQPTPASGKLSFIALARGAGYTNVHEFEDLKSLENDVETIINQAGPTFVCLRHPPTPQGLPITPSTMGEAVPRIRAILQRSSP